MHLSAAIRGEPRGHTRACCGICQLCSIILSRDGGIELPFVTESPGEDPRDLEISKNIYNIKHFKTYSRNPSSIPIP